MASTTLNLISSFIFGSEASFPGTASQQVLIKDTPTMENSNEHNEVSSFSNSTEILQSPSESNMAAVEKVSNYTNVINRKQSLVLVLSREILDKVKTYLDENLKFEKATVQNGYIYTQSSQTITYYPTTAKLHVQGNGYSAWVESFLQMNLDDLNGHQTSVKVIDTQPMASTPLPGIRERCEIQTNHFDDSDLSDVLTINTNGDCYVNNAISPNQSDINSYENGEMTDDSIEIKLLKERIAQLEEQLFFGTCTEPKEMVTVATQTVPTIKKRISIHLVEIQCDIPIDTCDQVSVEMSESQHVREETQNEPEPVNNISFHNHSLENISSESEPCETIPKHPTGNENSSQSNQTHTCAGGAGSSNTAGVNDGYGIDKTPKTLIIGSSIIKSIKPWELKDTVIRSHSGARIHTIRHQIRKMDLSPYRNIILLVGGNNCSEGRSLSNIEQDYDRLLFEMKERTDNRCNIYVSGLPPRSDTDVDAFNDMLLDICEYHNVHFINQNRYFYDERGFVKEYLYQHDGIHLNKRGTLSLVHNMDIAVPILKATKQRQYCRQCGEDNHTTEKCKYDKPIRCRACYRDGHKQKFCHLYH